jgi:hypothetical protein
MQHCGHAMFMQVVLLMSMRGAGTVFETNGMQFFIFHMQNRTFGSYLVK